MKLLFLGGDLRMIYAAERMHELGYEVTTYGLSTELSSGILCETVEKADAVILPLPISNDGMTVRTPLTNEMIYLDDIILCKPKYIYGGIIGKQLKDNLTAENVPFFDYYTDEPLTVKNAVLTAEAAVALAISGSNISLYRSKALVIGYGRIGKQLSSYLKALGAEVTATSRNSGTLATIEADGYIGKHPSDIIDSLPDYDFIFNTAPAPIMNRKFFSRCKPACFVEDLATGAKTDLTAAKEYGINADVYPGLPGKFFPLTAGRIIAETINDHIYRI